MKREVKPIEAGLSGGRQVQRGLKRVVGQGGLLLALLWISLPVQAKISRCDERAILSNVVEVPGVPLSSSSKAGDVLHRRVYAISVGYTVVNPINNDRMRMGAGWTTPPDSSRFDTVPVLPGLGVRWRHLEGGFDGRIIYAGHAHDNTWARGDDFPQAAGSYSKQEYFVQEFVLTDPKLYQGGTVLIMPAGLNIIAHGTGSGASEDVSKGCNDSTRLGNVKTPKLVYAFILDNWSGGTLPPLPKPSCKVSLSSQHQGVSMDSIKVSGLKRKDDVSQGRVSFSIRLEDCAINAKPSINFTDAGTPSNTSHTLFANNVNVSGSAKGLGVRLRRNGQTDLYFGPPDSSDSSRRIPLGTASSDTPVLTLDLNAHYVRTTDAAIQPGAFSATATFVVSYP
ncbi:type 1 fimbria pilin [Chromobacterium alkanivorans]|uniref:fimbrial protein n=1 Tax=Chromobacterium alkanivorans TaxID=1071719 RepID=UPI0021688C9C|nr:fimbrial protein [Chromobacterium alkanivorans]MCS3806104.1 type 1 fimbria pilin [Chromobacterium alkanivorans]MCS3820494.1 type 1 fimbria pilin [Chromobacterium alkanivorans]MCS3875252.1 type 1 fimbria pilin [Chromobacterium alkanivorans]